MKTQRLSQQALRNAKQIAPTGTGLIKTRLSSPASKENKKSKEKLLLAFHPLLLPSPKMLIFTAIASFK